MFCFCFRNERMMNMQNRIPSFFPVAMVKVRNPKRLMIVAALLFAILLSFVVWNLLPPDPDVLYTTPLSADQKSAIRSSLISKHDDKPDQIVRWGYVDPYYGTINGCVIFVVHPYKLPSQEAWYQKIAGYMFEWDSPIGLYAYREGSGVSCELWEAYSKGWLTSEHISLIHAKHIEYQRNFPQLLEQWKKTREESIVKPIIG